MCARPFGCSFSCCFFFWLWRWKEQTWQSARSERRVEELRRKWQGGGDGRGNELVLLACWLKWILWVNNDQQKLVKLWAKKRSPTFAHYSRLIISYDTFCEILTFLTSFQLFLHLSTFEFSYPYKTLRCTYSNQDVMVQADRLHNRNENFSLCELKITT